ncbi:MAG: beta-N-acetylhexosaminidase [Dongiaceae bacterium]
MTRIAVIFGCAGPTLDDAERRFFRAADPLGFILFKRNCAAPEQVRRLVGELRDAVGRADAPVLIDQEGGRVTRLGPPHWRTAPPAARFGLLAARDRDAAIEATRVNARLLAADLADLGITVDCAPVLDLRLPGAHDAIGDRAFHSDPEVVALLGRAMAEGLLAGGVIPVVKHMPGHGRAMVDSHAALPRVATSRSELEHTDFRPFRALNDLPWGMTAHVVFEAIDPARPTSTSPIVIGEVIRGHIGFDGLLVSDDVSMQALEGSLADRTRAALAAGCDVALHCNARIQEMEAVAAAAAPLSVRAVERLARGRERLGSPDAAERPALAARLETLLQG